MKAHEFAHQLLNGPDSEIRVHVSPEANTETACQEFCFEEPRLRYSEDRRTLTLESLEIATS